MPRRRADRVGSDPGRSAIPRSARIASRTLGKLLGSRPDRMGTTTWIIGLALRAFVYTSGTEEPTAAPTESPPTEDAPSEPVVDVGGPASVALEPVRFGDAADDRISKAFEAELRERLAQTMSLAPECTAEPCPARDE